MSNHWKDVAVFAVALGVVVLVLNEMLNVGRLEPTPGAVDSLAPAPAFSIIPLALMVCLVLFMAGILPIPVGYERGKVKWLTWCGTGMHAHICYWHGGAAGLQSIHPDDLSEKH